MQTVLSVGRVWVEGSDHFREELLGRLFREVA